MKEKKADERWSGFSREILIEKLNHKDRKLKNAQSKLYKTRDLGRSLMKQVITIMELGETIRVKDELISELQTDNQRLQRRIQELQVDNLDLKGEIGEVTNPQLWGDLEPLPVEEDPDEFR